MPIRTEHGGYAGLSKPAGFGFANPNRACSDMRTGFGFANPNRACSDMRTEQSGGVRICQSEPSMADMRTEQTGGVRICHDELSMAGLSD
ncbi:hypothetical protein QUF72_10930 [Desulfobacterales bacterium HSG2]|nr:hypothetical protein [Desulfobacterales bacterium HSG2]